jgi:uncharacterized protein YbaR (Trm112 family)
MPTEILQLLKCPSCFGALSDQDKKISCSTCNTVFPVVDGVPWLFDEPGKSMASWRMRFNALLASIQKEEDQLKHSAKQSDLSELTNKRLRKVLQGKVEQRKLLTDLMRPLIKEQSGNPELFQGMRIRDIAGQSIGGYYTNIHRDWAWPTEENSICLNTVLDLLKTEKNPKNILVLGAGAGRLAWDIHNSLKPEQTVALDINPLMILAARKVCKGRNLKLYEFPIAPRDLDSFAVLQTCSAPAETPDNLHFILADGLNPPVKAGAFDLILTPWFIDIIPTKLRETVLGINQLLAKGGRWVNFGSLAFNHSEAAANFSPEEALDIIKTQGFEIGNVQRKKIPYMQSPHSAHGRIEEIFGFLATKMTDKSIEIVKDRSQPWLKDFSLPVPLDKEFQTTKMIYSIYLDVVKLIDGKNSIHDIAKTFGPKHGLPTDDAAVSVKNFLERMLDTAARGQNV